MKLSTKKQVPYATALRIINDITFRLAIKPDWDSDTVNDIADILYRCGVLTNEAKSVLAVKKEKKK